MIIFLSRNLNISIIFDINISIRMINMLKTFINISNRIIIRINISPMLNIGILIDIRIINILTMLNSLTIFIFMNRHHTITINYTSLIINIDFNIRIFIDFIIRLIGMLNTIINTIF